MNWATISEGSRISLRRYLRNIAWPRLSPRWGSRNETTLGLRPGLTNDRAEPALPLLGGIAQFPEHADETSPGELRGQPGHPPNPSQAASRHDFAMDPTYGPL